MKKNYQTIISTVSCLVAVICLFQINGLKNEIEVLRSSLSGQISTVNSLVSDIYSNVDSKLKNEASLITASGYDYEELDVENGLVNMRIHITPKQYSPDKTEASVYINENKYEMTLLNGDFVLDFKVPIFEDSTVSKIVFTEDGIIKTESLDWYFSPVYEFIPTVDAFLSGSWHHGNGYDMSGTIEVDINAPLSKITKTLIVEKLDGKVENKESIDMKFDNTNEYYTHGYYEISKVLDVPKGSTYELYLAIEDESGLVYVSRLDRYELDSNGNVVDNNDNMYKSADIYDKEGNLLYRP